MTAEDQILALVGKAQRGDRGAFDQLIRDHQFHLRGIAQSRISVHHLRGRLDVEDVLQETLSRALQAIHKFQWRGESSFSKWLGGIAERVILEAVRRHRRDPRLRLPDVARDEVSPSKGLRRHERFDRLKAAIEELNPGYRQVIQLSRLEGLKIKDVAVRMNRTPEATKKLLSRALEQLKQKFGDTQSLHLPHRDSL